MKKKRTSLKLPNDVLTMDNKKAASLLVTLKHEFLAIEATGDLNTQIRAYGRKGYAKGAGKLPPLKVNALADGFARCTRPDNDTERALLFRVYANCYLAGMVDIGKLTFAQAQDMFVPLFNVSRFLDIPPDLEIDGEPVYTSTTLARVMGMKHEEVVKSIQETFPEIPPTTIKNGGDC